MGFPLCFIYLIIMPLIIGCNASNHLLYGQNHLQADNRQTGGIDPQDQPIVAEGHAVPRARVRVMIVFKEVGKEGISTVEHALIRAFTHHGYTVLDRHRVGLLLRSEANQLPHDDVDAAKLLGFRLGADIVISASSQVTIEKKEVASLGRKEMTVSHADVVAKAVVVCTGKVLVAALASAAEPFDPTGVYAEEKAAQALAGKLFPAFDQRFLNRDLVAYHLALLNITHHEQAQAFQKTLGQIPGVRQVNECRFIKDAEKVELEVHVAQNEDVAFQGALFQLSGFEVAAHAQETIYLRRIGKVPQPCRKDCPHQGDGAFNQGYHASWGVVIGINTYHDFDPLQYAINDARAVAASLQGLGFTVITLLDEQATRQNIVHVLHTELPSKAGPDDRVVIFFSGHGESRIQADGHKKGYIIPVDARQGNDDARKISMEQLRDLSQSLRAKHVFYVLDSCFAGLFIHPRGDAPASFHQMTTARAWQVMTAGAAGQRAFEDKDGQQGIFTRVFLEGLRGQADLNGDGIITAPELFRYSAPRVKKESRGAQDPQFSAVVPGQGEFVLVFKE